MKKAGIKSYISVLSILLVIPLSVMIKSTVLGVQASEVEKPGCDDGSLAQMLKDREEGKEAENNIDDQCGQIVLHATPIIAHPITPIPQPKPTTLPCFPPCNSMLKIPCIFPLGQRLCPTPQPTQIPLPTPRPTNIPMPTPTNVPVPTQEATPTPTNVPTENPTETPVPTQMPTVTPTPGTTTGTTGGETNTNNNTNTTSQDVTQNANPVINITNNNTPDISNTNTIVLTENTPAVLGASTQTNSVTVAPPAQASSLPSTGSETEILFTLLSLIPAGAGLRKFAKFS